MRSPRSTLSLLFLSTCFAALAAAPAALVSPLDSATPKTTLLTKADKALAPEFTRENKPWTRWWWPGSAVNKADITAQLEKFAAAGLGGVEITPIYGAKGYEDRYIDFLSPRWMEMLEHVGQEAKRLGLGVDMATGTGWPFGGPWIDTSQSLKKLSLAGGQLEGLPTQMKVKRAAPGDEGLVLDPYSAEAMKRYLEPFSNAFASFPAGLVRGQFHDSFEYFGASWTPRLAAVFQEMHGYPLQEHAAQLMGTEIMDEDRLARLKSDYRETLARLHQEYLQTWATWSHEHGFLVRNQSHGAPGNLIDLYANADIAETEVFGSTPFPIPGLRRQADEIRHDQDLPEPLVLRLASSAAHLAGHPLVSSETCTWLRDHWKVSLAYTKPEIDRLFACGINHIFYHGTVFSPQDVAWPGWLFYASTQFHPNNTWWDDFSALNRYVARVQAALQAGRPDNDVLLYWPLADVWHDAEGSVKQLTMHKVQWITEQPVGKIAAAFIEQGYSFDTLSDAFLQKIMVEKGQLLTPGARYHVLVVPATKHMPLESLKRLLELADKGATVIFEKLPEDVPGLGRLEERRALFKQALATRSPRVLVQPDVLAALASQGTRREALVEQGLSFIRRTTDAGHVYFLSNLGAQKVEGWVPLCSTLAKGATLVDPLTGQSGRASTLHLKSQNEVYLQLAPGESRLLVVNDGTQRSSAKDSAKGWNYTRNAGAPTPLTGTWKIEFLKGGPVLPATLTTTELKSWTEFPDEELKRFGGTARYTLEFEAPAGKADDWLLDLGDLRECARVRLNGSEVSTLWSLPFRVRLGKQLRPGKNTLELEVTNLAANRIRDLDRRGVNWKIMREINFVNINYKPFDASQWELMPSGLLGPVTLTGQCYFTPGRDN